MTTETYFIGRGFRFRGLVHYGYGGLQADTVLKKELRIGHLNYQAQEDTETLGLA